MFDINQVNNIYIATGATDLRKSIDGLVGIVTGQLQLNPYEKALFVFCNRAMNRLKVLHFSEGFWLYYYRLEHGRFKWPINEEEALKVNRKDLQWLLKGYEIRTTSKFKPKIKGNLY